MKLNVITGSIRRKLMLFAVMLCAVLLGLIWLLNVQLLEPFYNSRIQAELERTADAYANIASHYDKLEDYAAANGVDPDFYDEIVSLPDAESLLTGKCLDISDSQGYNLLHSHALSGECRLHPTLQSVFGERSEVNWNARYVMALRQLVLKEGDLTFTLREGGKPQMVVCRNVNNTYVVIVSTGLERIDEAARVIGFQMPVIAVGVLALGILGAYLFSRWFTRPLTALSRAAREMAAGNYSVRVQRTSGDEIGALASDFNSMAGEVQAAAQLQRDLIANISHDLRTPLTLIKGYAETVRDISGDNPQRRAEQLDVIIDETDRLSSLVNSVMELSKMSSGTERCNPVRFDLAQLCDEVACRYTDACEKQSCTLQVQADTPCPVMADPDLLSRVLHNFLSNALHHTPAGGQLSLRCTPQPEGSVRVEVSDTGEGIAAADLPHVFDRYYRTRASEGKPGTGLGLSIAKAILTTHGFAFGVESTLGKGTTFWFVAEPLPEKPHTKEA